MPMLRLLLLCVLFFGLLLPSAESFLARTSFVPSPGANTLSENTLFAKKNGDSSSSGRRRTWDESYARLVQFHKEHGHANVPWNGRDKHLFNWLAKQRERQDLLKSEQYAKLDALNVSWNKNEKWFKMFRRLESFQDMHGHCNVPRNSAYNTSIAEWMEDQRLHYSKGQLLPERIEKLEKVGVDWTFDPLWINKFDELVEYKERFGHCNVPHGYPENTSLATWVERQRKFFSKDELLPERIEKLESIGFLWNWDQAWMNKFDEISQFKEKFGHCNVPRDEKQLYTWVITQRVAHNKAQLEPWRLEKLESIDFIWHSKRYPQERRQVWMNKFNELIQFKEKFGHCNVPSTWKENKSLANWVTNQRSFFSKGKLLPERIQKLDSIGFRWSSGGDFEQHQQWNDRFEELVQFKEKYGHCSVPRNWKENKSLARWVSAQRTQFSKGALSPVRIEKLESIDFCWSCDHEKEQRWKDRFHELLQYKERFGHCNVPSTWKENKYLVYWVHTQRTSFSNGKLLPERIEKLESAGFQWRLRTKRRKGL